MSEEREVRVSGNRRVSSERVRKDKEEMGSEGRGRRRDEWAREGVSLE